MHSIEIAVEFGKALEISAFFLFFILIPILTTGGNRGAFFQENPGNTAAAGSFEGFSQEGIIPGVSSFWLSEASINLSQPCALCAERGNTEQNNHGSALEALRDLLHGKPAWKARYGKPA